MDDLLPPRSGVLRWSAAAAAGLTLHALALALLLPRTDDAPAVAGPESVLLIDLPPEPELPPLESATAVAVPDVAAVAPPTVPMAEPVEPAELADTTAIEAAPSRLPPPAELTPVQPDAAEDAAPAVAPAITEASMAAPADIPAPLVPDAVDPAPAAVEMAETAPSVPGMAQPAPAAIPTPPSPPVEITATRTEATRTKPPRPALRRPTSPPAAQPPGAQTPAAQTPVDAQPPGAGGGQAVEDALAAYRSAIRRAIVGRRRASDAGSAEGRAIVAISIDRSGAVVRLDVSGAPAVSDAATRLIRRVGSFPAVPDALPAPFSVTVPIDFVRG